MNDNKFLKHFTIIGTGTALNLLLGLFTTPLITRLVDPIEYGQFSIFTMYSSIAVMVLCMGLDQAVVRFYYERESLGYKRALLFRCINPPIIVSFLVTIIIAICAYNHFINFEFSVPIMIMLCFYSLTELVYRFSLLVVRLEYRSKLYSVLSIIKKLTYVCITLFLLMVIGGDDLLILTSSTFIASFVCMIVSIIAQAQMWNIFQNRDTECTIDYKILLKYAYPYVITMGITTLFQAIDKIALNLYCTYTEVGIYSSTMTLVHIFAIIQTTFNTLWSPMAVKHYTKYPKDKKFYQKGNQIITVVMFFIGISLILVKDVFAILLGEKYREAAYILPFLIFNPIMYTISETTVTGLVFKKKSRVHIIVAVGACITNIIGNNLLVPKLGSQGAAISTGIAYIIFFSLRTFLSNKYFYIDFNLKKFYLLTAVVSLYALYNTFVKFNIGSVIGYIICVSLLLVLYRDIIYWGTGYLRENYKIFFGK
ncbi:lipopolysaccharide biosynthesis protein [Murimonas intestini]|uniref:O-antigen/teichoic acid export membrane protein n=2 Tax=Murimonas intestini TaxID=1337051 RepID=A0AB73T546_9FIRM|nr:lipopolysaccharide biosynthesis protein [Murimonas intestini]MCR1865259.1 lipopolysaccharide biosynthesis protein [Murimonas intestini]MCR1883023.1 lipopolysaccharide biosynthesis protein [Murimonas intestini]